MILTTRLFAFLIAVATFSWALAGCSSSTAPASVTANPPNVTHPTNPAGQNHKDNVTTADPALNPHKAAPSIVGTWVVTSYSIDGEEVPNMPFIGDKHNFREDGTGTVTLAKGGVSKASHYKLDAAANPMTLETKDDKASKGLVEICEIEGDTMKLKSSTDLGGERHVIVLTLKRAKN